MAEKAFSFTVSDSALNMRQDKTEAKGSLGGDLQSTFAN
jgi:hypothetical protein